MVLSLPKQRDDRDLRLFFVGFGARSGFAYTPNNVLRATEIGIKSLINNRNHRRLPTMAKKNAAPTKSEILAQIAKDTELSKKQVGAVFESLNGIIKKSLRGAGSFTMPGLLKLKVVKKPATKAREGVNPFTGEKMVFKAKPASKKVRAAALKSLKEMVN
jgi:nucleoid DNA-binding protein